MNQPHSLCIPEVSSNQTASLHGQLLYGINSQEDTFWTTTVLTCSSLGLSLIFSTYPHKLGLLFLTQQPPSVTLYLEWLLGIRIGKILIKPWWKHQFSPKSSILISVKKHGRKILILTSILMFWNHNGQQLAVDGVRADFSMSIKIKLDYAPDVWNHRDLCKFNHFNLKFIIFGVWVN